MENNVVTLDTAKKLKAAGFPQHSAYGWGYSTDAPAAAPELQDKVTWYLAEGTDCGAIAAPTAQEIADQLPKGIRITRYPESPIYVAGRGGVYGRSDDTMAEALTALWLQAHAPQPNQGDEHE